MVSIIISLIFVAIAVYFFARSIGLLHEVVAPNRPQVHRTGAFRTMGKATGLTILFSTGVISFVAGFSGLVEKAIQFIVE